MDKSDFEIEKRMLVDNLNTVKGMTDGEYVLYRKFDELKSYPLLPSEIQKAKERLWHGDNIESLKPTVVIIGRVEDDRENFHLWNVYRHLITVAEFNSVPARNIRLFLIDETTNKILGIGCVSSDFNSLRDRDKFIGWDVPTRQRNLVHTANGSTIVPVQPFGFNFLGGKLLASLITSKIVREEWQRRYGQVLAGMTTTSLYGGFSMYDRIPCWKALGETEGKVSLMPDRILYEYWRRWFKKNQAESYEKITRRTGTVPTTNQKARINNGLFSSLGLNPNDYQHGHKRGIYFSEFYHNTKDFLCGRINETELQPKTDFDTLRWWKPKALNRYNNLKTQNRLQTEQLWLDDVRSMTWEQVQTKYL